ncbi:MAG TPA: TetR/AcrR family transcriptional regulator [Gemmatimonadaceae bacterium]
MPLKKTSRDKLLEAAEAEMLAKGYAGTTVDEICARASVSKGNFYHFFSSKEDLGLALLDDYYERNLAIIGQAPTPGSDPRRHARALVDHLIDSAGTMWGGGCLMGTFALELAETNPTIANAVSARFRSVAERLTDGFLPLVSGKKRKDAAEIAEQFIVTVEGALVLARAHHDWSYVDRALARFRKTLGLPQGAAK